jgi:membrane protease YdiL (CAAX protease family)
LPVPSIGTLIGFWIAPGPLGQSVYLACKLWIVVLPLVWALGIERQRPSASPLAPERLRSGIVAGLGLGGGMAGLIVAAWFVVGRSWIDPGQLRDVASAAGLSSPLRYVLFGAYLVLVNSLLEEMVWRWFVFTRFRSLIGAHAAVLASALCFTVHHAFMLGLVFDPAPAALGSLGILAAGGIWSACYMKYGSIWPGYLSHVAATLAALAIGWILLFPAQ